ncbi:glycoside hydrolase family 31 protein [Clostridium sp. Marseille-P2415]|uniref:glycoside hydrolase family 31 protein n=1 Tax=Clostridium sp. Marseille-P2415 TaxID=1805471 RepID=UPI0009887A77|nr:TIM-barrel domain-containing protein [Clostridium sp. Marseille-P2415]
MKVCHKAEMVTGCHGYFSVQTNCIEIRIMFLADDIIRIRAGFDGDWDEASYSLVMTAWKSRTDELMKNCRRQIEPSSAELRDSGDRVVIQGRRLRIEVQKDPFLIRVYDKNGSLLHEDIPDLAYREDSNHRRLHTSRIEADDFFYGFGEKSGEINKAEKFMNMAPGDAMGYNPKETDSLYKHIPFYIKLSGTSREAVGYFYHNTAECSFNMGREKRNYWHRHSTYCTDAGDIDLFLIAGPSIREIIERYTDLTGKSVMLPKTALGYLGSSMYYPELPADSDDSILEFIDTTKEEEIPIDGFQLSSGYCAVETEEGIKRCTFTWNKKRFKNPKQWFAEMKRRGIVVSPNIKPGMLLVHPMLKEMKEKDMFVKASDSDEPGVGTWWGGKGIFVDFTKESVRQNWKSYITENLLQYGCESIWNDNCEYDSIVDKDVRVYFEGKGDTIGNLKPVMSNLMCQLSNEAIVEYDSHVRPFSVCRSGHAGIQRYAQVWAGDNLTCWEALKYNIATMLGMSLSGVANQGCDVGGFYGIAPEPELLVRWVQNGIFMPRFSIHSTNTDNTVTEPWMYSNMKKYIRDAIWLRYSLIPYLYSLMERAHESGLPILEPVLSAFQNDSKTYNEGVDFMFGDSILVANVVEKGAAVRKVYLPEGAFFYDFETRQSYKGGQEIEVPVDISSIPMFVRSGAIIPMSGNRLMNLMTEKTTSLNILLAPDVNSEFTLYEDDGISNDYLQGLYLKTQITVEAGTQTLIKFTNQGSYKTDVESIFLDVIHREKAPFYVLADKKEIHHFLHRKKFEEAECGWYYSQRLKSVQIKYPNPKKNHEVLISFEQFDLIGM